MSYWGVNVLGGAVVSGVVKFFSVVSEITPTYDPLSDFVLSLFYFLIVSILGAYFVVGLWRAARNRIKDPNRTSLLQV